MQGDIFDNQIPSKVYEYFAANKQVLAITPPNSETALLLKQEVGCYTAENVNEITGRIKYLLHNESVIDRDISQYERRERTKQLVKLLNLTVISQ